MAYGTGADLSARDFARATNSRFLGAVVDPQVLAGFFPDVVFALVSDVDCELLDALYANRDTPKGAPSLIVGNNRQDLALKARRFARRNGRIFHGEVKEVWPDLPFTTVSSGRRHIYGSNAGVALLRTTLTDSTSLLAIHAHSNGYDLLIGESLALCAITPWRTDSRPPACVISGYCHHLKQTIESATASGGVVRPSDIRAQILVLMTCHGFLIESHAHNSLWGYTSAILSNGRTDCIITSWSVIVPSSKMVQYLLNSLYSGASCSVAVAEVNKKFPNSCFAIFGNGDSRLYPLDQVERSAFTIEQRLQPSCNASPTGLAMLAFQAALTSEGRLAELAAKASESARIAAHVIAQGYSSDDDNPVAAKMRDDVIEFLANNGSLLFEFWRPFALGPPAVRHFHCPNCATHAKAYSYRLATPGDPVLRELCCCPACGPISDTPVNWRLSLRIRDNHFSIEGPRPQCNWRAVLHLGSQDRKAGRSFNWPADSAGYPVESLSFPSEMPAGPLLVGLIMIVEAEIGVMNVAIPSRS